MHFCSFLAAASAFLAATVSAAPVNNPSGDFSSEMTTTVYFSPGTTQDLVEDAARFATAKGAEILGYFGLPPSGKTRFPVRIVAQAAHTLRSSLTRYGFRSRSGL